MKTPEEWMEVLKDHQDCKQPTSSLLVWSFVESLVENIQRDALNQTIGQQTGMPTSFPPELTDEQEYSIIKDICDQLKAKNARLENELERLGEKLRERKKHLREANRGAERNSVALDLAQKRYWDLIGNDKRWKERDEWQHKTIVWNWLCMSDDDFRLKCGELSSQDLRNIRVVLKAMLGTSLLKHL